MSLESLATADLVVKYILADQGIKGQYNLFRKRSCLMRIDDGGEYWLSLVKKHPQFEYFNRINASSTDRQMDELKRAGQYYEILHRLRKERAQKSPPKSVGMDTGRTRAKVRITMSTV